jgi:hypothetical protein
MSLADVDKFFRTEITIRPGQSEALEGNIDGIEMAGEALIAGAVEKGNALGYEFTSEEVSTWIEQQRAAGTGKELPEIDLDAIADAFRARDKWLDGEK